MTKFIELTDFNDESLMVNVANIIWIRPYKGEDGSTIYVTSSQGRNDYPLSLNVKESYSQVTKLINN